MYMIDWILPFSPRPTRLFLSSAFYSMELTGSDSKGHIPRASQCIKYRNRNKFGLFVYLFCSEAYMRKKREDFKQMLMKIETFLRRTPIKTHKPNLFRSQIAIHCMSSVFSNIQCLFISQSSCMVSFGSIFIVWSFKRLMFLKMTKHKNMTKLEDNKVK